MIYSYVFTVFPMYKFVCLNARNTGCVELFLILSWTQWDSFVEKNLKNK